MEKPPKNIVSFIQHFVYQFKWQFLFMVFSRIMGPVLETNAMPYAFGLFIEKVIALSQSNDGRIEGWTVLACPAIFVVVLWISVGACFRLYDFVKMKTLPSFESRIRMSTLKYLHKHSYQFFTEHLSGDLAKRVNSLVDGISDMLTLSIAYFIPTLVSVIISVISFTAIHPSFGIILGLLMILHLGIYFLYFKKFNDYAARYAECTNALSGHIVDNLNNMLTMKLFAKRHQELQSLQYYQDKEQESYQKSLGVAIFPDILISILYMLFIGVGMTGFMVYNWQQGKMSTGNMILIFNTSWHITATLWETVSILPDFFEYTGICRQAFVRILKEKHAIQDLHDAVPFMCTKGEIKFENVCFQYEKSHMLFNNINVCIQGGEKVGLVGFSGSGKSTFINLLLRFFDLNNGKIAIDGQNITTVTQHSLRQQISVISQETSLFHRSILENIRYGCNEASDNEIIEAAKKAECHRFISQLPQGYHTIAGEHGAKLSGGQRQRIAIARAILKKAPILVLDEATTALDSITENIIQKSLKQLMKDKTTIVVAHRLATVCDMDRILVFAYGSIIEEGTHKQLIETNGHYAHMFRLQTTEEFWLE